MSYELPPYIRLELEQKVLEKASTAELSAAAEALSLRYRRETSAQNCQIKGEAEALAYLVSRLPATYASNVRVLAEVVRALPDFAPKTVLDIGAGPGTASVAVSQTFDSIENVTLVEPNAHLRQAGMELLSSYISSPVWGAGQVESFVPSQTFDVVLASYVLNETPLDQVQKQVEKLWASCSGVMIILEPGTPQGAEIIGKIREFAIGCDNTVLLAPCPHNGACPLAGIESRWCHFAVRTNRTRLHKTLKGGDAGFEDEKFSYIVLSRFPDKQTYYKYRLIGYPSGTKLREVQVCGPNGAETLQVSKSHPLHKLSKKLDWGDGFDL